MLALICFFISHLNPAKHTAEFVRVYEEQGIPCKVIVDPSVSHQFDGLSCEKILIDESMTLEDLTGYAQGANLVITDVSTKRWADLHRRFAEVKPEIVRAVYYDNPESFVPGEYSRVAQDVLPEAQVVLFSNATHAHQGVFNDHGLPIDLRKQRCYGVGYFPLQEAEEIRALRANSQSKKKTYVYVGGANDVYYHKAFPHFLDLLSHILRDEPHLLENRRFLLQQHPRAKMEGNVDANMMQAFLDQHRMPKGFELLISKMPTLEALAQADGVFYYQTSMAVQFAFAGIPQIAQIAHETYPDILIRNGYPSITRESQLKNALINALPKGDEKSLKEDLGVDEHWKDRLMSLIAPERNM